MTNKEIKPTVKRAMPVYLNLVKLNKLIEMLSTTRVSTVTTDELKGEFGATDASIAMGALKFLDLVDDNGTAKEATKGFHLKGEEKEKAIEQIVKSSYSELFSFVVDGEPYALPVDKLENHFTRVYNIVPRISSPAVRAFLYLCEEAGLKEKTTTIKKTTSKPKAETKLSKTKSVPAKKTSGQHEGRTPEFNGSDKTAVPFADGEICLVIPTKLLGNVEIITEYKTVVEAVQAFAEKCKPVLGSNAELNDRQT